MSLFQVNESGYVSSREIYEAIGKPIKSFASWMPAAIKRYGFTPKQYLKIKLQLKAAGPRQTDYLLSEAVARIFYFNEIQKMPPAKAPAPETTSVSKALAVASEETSAPSAFNFENNQIRTVQIDSSLWFAARDITQALGIVWDGKRQLSRIPKRWQRVGKFPTSRGQQKMVIISEPAVYKLAFRSYKGEAELFTEWVASEVLPSVRKTGGYQKTESLPEIAPPQGAEPMATWIDRIKTEARAYAQQFEEKYFKAAMSSIAQSLRA